VAGAAAIVMLDEVCSAIGRVPFGHRAYLRTLSAAWPPGQAGVDPLPPPPVWRRNAL
jgi:hypothetical protein